MGHVSPARIVAAVLLIVLLAAALSIDVVKTGQGNKSDEATYVMMALIAGAFAERMKFSAMLWFIGLWAIFVYAPIAHWVWGPDGIFLKRGKQIRLRMNGSLPFLHLVRTPDPRPDRLYFGKAFIYSLIAAPFVRVLGLNGILVFHVLLAFAACVCGYLFLAARSGPL